MSSTAPRATDIRAAGGLLWRPDGFGGVEVAVVHRPRYDDWSLPKGKLDGHEAPLLAAVREVGEETGRSARVDRRLATVRYDVGNRAKAVQYWSMRDAGPLGPHGGVIDVDEVDRLDWLPLAGVGDRLTYADDRGVVAAFARLAPTTSVVVLVRHARAGKRSQWAGDDALRPLDERGRVQAEALGALLDVFRPDTVWSADRVRCEQTVEPLARRRGVAVQPLPQVSDEAWEADPAAAVQALDRLAGRDGVAVVCSQGSAIPGVLGAWLPPRLGASVTGTVTRKGAYWVVGAVQGVPAWIDRYDRPS